VRAFNGTFALIGGFIGLVGFGYGLYNHSLDVLGGLIFALLILNGLWATWRKVTGRGSGRVRGPLSKRKRRS